MWKFCDTSQLSSRSVNVTKVSPLASGYRYFGSRSASGVPFVPTSPSVAHRPRARASREKSKSLSGPTPVSENGGRPYLITSNNAVLWETTELLKYIDNFLTLTTDRSKNFVAEHRLSASYFLGLKEDEAYFIAGGDDALARDIISVSKHVRSYVSVKTLERRHPRATEVFPELGPMEPHYISTSGLHGHDNARAHAGRPTASSGTASPPISEWNFDDTPPSTPRLAPAVAAGLAMLEDTVGYIPGDAGTSPAYERRARYFFDDNGHAGRGGSPDNGDDHERSVALFGDDDAAELVPVAPVENSDNPLSTHLDAGSGDPQPDADGDSSVREDDEDLDFDSAWGASGTADVHGRNVRISEAGEDIRTYSSTASDDSERYSTAEDDIEEQLELDGLPISLATTQDNLNVHGHNARDSVNEHAIGAPPRAHRTSNHTVRSSATGRPLLHSLTANLADRPILSPVRSISSDWSPHPGTATTPLTSWYEGSPTTALLAEIRRTPFSKLLSLPSDGQGVPTDSGRSHARHRGRSLSVNDAELVRLLSSPPHVLNLRGGPALPLSTAANHHTPDVHSGQ
ncbi:hypothetical protein OBBRIDRAFT_831400 [Obba rivulosa]|uniref:Uncharacterized protein n=1 Tax=Obba rivulosa TaxID=1052685 RepID=A0A8E2DS47_9APHY|nr:hypothetical protein OBBRIDRAFT_831400 [Obba rivulosa]